MKYSLEGFSQERLVEFYEEETVNGKTVTRYVDASDVFILRWFVDFWPNMNKINYDGKKYAFLSLGEVCDDMPLLRLSRRSLSEHLQKLSRFGILDYKVIRENGTYTVLSFGSEYSRLDDGKVVKSE